jgi:16S rRNA (cytosine967-C5)-methyltransferase
VIEPARGRLDAAVSALQVVLGMTRPADVALKAFFRDHHELGQNDRAFVAELVFTVLRHLRLLENLVGEPMPRRLALAALTLQTGFSVRELAPLLIHGDETWLARARAVDQAQLPPAIRLSLPDWLYERLARDHPQSELERLARGMLQPAPLDLRVNTLVATRDEVLTAFERDGIPAKPTPYAPAGVRLATKPALQRHPLFLEGKVEVQDEGSQLLSYLVAPRRREMVVDFCAGAGGKTLALGALMHSEGRLYAFDTAEKRLTNLKPRLKRSALSNVHPQLISSESDVRVKRLAAKIDRVLVDAPCSGMGTLRRNPDLKWRQRPESVAEMAVKQRAILAAAARLIKPGGRLVYATCSLLPEENEAIVDGFLGSDPRFHLADSAEILRRQGIALDTGEYFRVFPHSHGMDGFFAAVLERAEEDAKK